MFPRIKNVRHLTGYRLQLVFTDDSTAELDLSETIVGRGGVFAPLQDIEFFKQVEVNAEACTLVWPNGVDFCPDVLYSEATGTPIQVLQPA